MLNKTKYWYYTIEKIKKANDIIHSDGVVSSKNKYFPLKDVDIFCSEEIYKFIAITFVCEISKEDFEYKYAQLSKSKE